ncbi:MAG: NAD-binding protein [Sulfurospirillaceae bacterium]|nr:NAD-binding protein [Sulfurospirillaceae bacterium]
MQVIIAGAGRVGYTVAKHLMKDNDVTVIDQNEFAIKNIQENLDVLAICGNIENPHTYMGVSAQIDLFIAVTDSDETNLLSALIIDSITTVKKKIIRLRNDFFANSTIKEKLNISETIIPSFEAAQPFKYLVDFPHAHNVKTFAYTKALLVSVRLRKDFEPTMISKFVNNFNNELSIAGVERDKTFYTPKPIEMLLANDLVYFFAYPKAIIALRSVVYDWNEVQTPIKNCIIVGADSLGVEIAKVLLKKGIDVQIMDKDMALCKKANLELKNKVDVTKTNYDADHINDKNKFDTDMFIVATRKDEYNITKCLEAKQKGIKKIVGINNDLAYSSLMRNMNIEVVRGEKINAYYSILEKIDSSQIIVQKKFCGGDGVIVLRKIFANSTIIGKKIELPSKIEEKGHFIALRDEEMLCLRDIDIIKKDDIIVFFTKEENFELLSKWLKNI